MPKIFSPFATGDAGAALFNAGRHLFGGNPASGADQYALDKDYEQQRQNVETENAMRFIASQGIDAFAKSPIGQAMVIGSGYDPTKVGQIGLLGSALTNGAAADTTQNWQVGSGQSYDNTAAAVGAKLAEQVRAHNVESADRRDAIGREIMQKMYEFAHPSAFQKLQSDEAIRHNTATEAQTKHDSFYKPEPVILPGGGTGFANTGELVGSSNSPIISDADRKGTLAGENFGHMGDLPGAEQNYLSAGGPGTSAVLPADVEAQKVRIAQAGAARTIGTPPAGFRVTYDANNNPVGMEPIPGSPQALEAAAAQQALADKNANQTTANSVVLEDLGRAKTLVENAPWYDPAVGTFGKLLANVGGTNAANLASLTETIKANIGFDRLQQMRQESPTGGALGQISDTENTLLSSVFGSLAQSQGPEQFLENLNRLTRIYQTVLKKAAAYPNAAKFGFAGGAPEAGGAGDGPPAHAGAAPEPGAIEEGYQFLGGDPKDPANWQQVQ